MLLVEVVGPVLPGHKVPHHRFSGTKKPVATTSTSTLTRTRHHMLRLSGGRRHAHPVTGLHHGFLCRYKGTVNSTRP